MIKKLSHYIGEYKKITIITPILMVLEVAFEVVIPFLMGHIIDDGIKVGDIVELTFETRTVKFRVDKVVETIRKEDVGTMYTPL